MFKKLRHHFGVLLANENEINIFRSTQQFYEKRTPEYILLSLIQQHKKFMSHSSSVTYFTNSNKINLTFKQMLRKITV